MKKFFFISLLSLLIIGCDILNTREPEQPDTGRKTYLPATTPDILFLNLKNSLKEKVLENYMACFVDNAFISVPFFFRASPEAVAAYPVLADWDLSGEQQYFNNLSVNTRADTPIILTLQNEIKNTMGDSANYQYDYIISLTPIGDKLHKTYKGNLEFTIYLDSRNQWSIARWVDHKIGNNPSWSELKGTLY
jgi:hypothetical protein